MQQNLNLKLKLQQSVQRNLTSVKSLNATTQSISDQNSDIKNTVTQPQSHNNPNTNESQRNVYIIMGFNRKFTNLKELVSQENTNGSVTVIPCGNVNSAVNQYLRHNLGYEKYKLFNVSKFILLLPTF